MKTLLWVLLCSILLPVVAPAQVSDWEFECRSYMIPGFEKETDKGFRLKNASFKACVTRQVKAGWYFPVVGKVWLDFTKEDVSREAYISMEFNPRFIVWFGKFSPPFIYYIPPPEKAFLAYAPFTNYFNCFEIGLMAKGKFGVPLYVADTVSYEVAIFNGTGHEEDNNDYKDALYRLSFGNELYNIFGCWSGGVQPEGHREIWNVGASLYPDSTGELYFRYLDLDSLRAFYYGLRATTNILDKPLEVVFQFTRIRREQETGHQFTFGLNVFLDKDIFFRFDVVGYYKFRPVFDMVYRFRF